MLVKLFEEQESVIPLPSTAATDVAQKFQRILNDLELPNARWARRGNKSATLKGPILRSKDDKRIRSLSDQLVLPEAAEMSKLY
jgi:hypothetical protein